MKTRNIAVASIFAVGTTIAITAYAAAIDNTYIEAQLIVDANVADHSIWINRYNGVRNGVGVVLERWHVLGIPQDNISYRMNRNLYWAERRLENAKERLERIIESCKGISGCRPDDISYNNVTNAEKHLEHVKQQIAWAENYLATHSPNQATQDVLNGKASNNSSNGSSNSASSSGVETEQAAQAEAAAAAAAAAAEQEQRDQDNLDRANATYNMPTFNPPDNYGCKAMLCFAGGQGVSECQDTIKKVLKDIRKGKGFPQCSSSGYTIKGLLHNEHLSERRRERTEVCKDGKHLPYFKWTDKMDYTHALCRKVRIDIPAGISPSKKSFSQNWYLD